MMDERASQRASLGSGEVAGRYELERNEDPKRSDKNEIEKTRPAIPHS